MVGWHHQLDAYEFETAPGAGDGQGSLMCCSPWGCKVLDMTEQVKNNNKAVKSNISLLSGELWQAPSRQSWRVTRHVSSQASL